MPVCVHTGDVAKSCQEVQNFLDHFSLQPKEMCKLLYSVKLPLVNTTFNVFLHQFIWPSFLLSSGRFYLPEREENSKETNGIEPLKRLEMFYCSSGIVKGLKIRQPVILRAHCTPFPVLIVVFQSRQCTKGVLHIVQRMLVSSP